MLLFSSWWMWCGGSGGVWRCSDSLKLSACGQLASCFLRETPSPYNFLASLETRQQNIRS
jgi:hypothetical protein